MNEKEKLLTPGITTWLMSIIFGIIIPLFAQEYIAGIITQLTATTPPNSFALIPLVLLFTLYMLALSFNIYFIVLTKKIHTVLALTFSLTAPAFIWLALPYFLSSL